MVVGVSGSNEITGIETFGLSVSTDELDKMIELASQAKEKLNKAVEAGIKKFKDKGKIVDIDIN